MKNKLFVFFLSACSILFLSALAVAQENSGNEWYRVRSDSGELSVDFPANYEFIKDKEGFTVSNGTSDYPLKEVQILNAFYEKTLLGVEVYQTDSPRAVADAMLDREQKNGKREKSKSGEIKFEQMLIAKDDAYAIRRFYASENYLYILTAASRGGETPAMKRFLDSLSLKFGQKIFEPTLKNTEQIKTVAFSDLKVLRLEIEELSKPPKSSGGRSILPVPVKDENSLPLIILVKSPPSYTKAARRGVETGVIRMRLTFSPNGSISKIGILSSLDYGLLRQSVFSALQIKAIPAEKNGEPVSVTKTVEYSFSIY